jgi:hypothetical protein
MGKCHVVRTYSSVKKIRKVAELKENFSVDGNEIAWGTMGTLVLLKDYFLKQSTRQVSYRTLVDSVGMMNTVFLFVLKRKPQKETYKILKGFKETNIIRAMKFLR